MTQLIFYKFSYGQTHDPRIILWTAVLLLAASATGCEQPNVFGKVSGKVTFQGEPVTAGLVLLSNAEKGIHVTAKIDDDSTFEVTTADGLGLPPGSYQVAVTPPRIEFPIDPTEAPAIIPEPPNIPPKYRNAATSELTLNIREGENSLNIDMQP